MSKGCVGQHDFRVTPMAVSWGHTTAGPRQVLYECIGCGAKEWRSNA